MFRDPREHVLSQFSHCFANPHGAASMSPLWGFPRGNKGDTPKLGWMNGLNKWLKHFGENWHREDGYFNCFNPINMQARYLTCGAKDEVKDKEIHTGAERWGTPDDPGRAVWFQSAHYLGANDEAEPDLEKLIRRLDSMQVVGVTEAMKATACLLEYQSRGTVHPQCECGSDERKFPWKEQRNEAYQPYAFAEILRTRPRAGDERDARGPAGAPLRREAPDPRFAARGGEDGQEVPVLGDAQGAGRDPGRAPGR